MEDPNYVPSAILSKMVKDFYETSAKYIPFLKASSRFEEICTDQSFDKTMAQIYNIIEPIIVHVRPGTK